MNALTETPTHPHLKTTNKTLAWVLAAANEMIEESLYHCETFAHTLRAHHNAEAADIFDRLYPKLRDEQSIVLAHLKEIDLQSIPPWEIPHQEYEHPATALTHAHYLMTESECWKMAAEMIQVHTCFYSHILQDSHSPEVKDLVQLLQRHCLQCQQICQTEAGEIQTAPEDFDPPNTQG